MTSVLCGNTLMTTSGDVEMKFQNFYFCEDCDIEWDNPWDSMCDDECPGCGHDFSPVHSEEIDPEFNEFCPVGDSLLEDSYKDPARNMHCSCWYDGDGCCRCKALPMTEDQKRLQGMLDD